MTTLRAEREKAKLTQSELSRLSGVPQAVISDIEKGITKNPRLDTIRRLSSVLCFDISDFVVVTETEVSA